MNNNNLLFTCRKIVESHREALVPSTTMNTPKSSLQTLRGEEKWLSGDNYKESNIEYIDAYLVSKSCNDSILPDNWHCISNTTKCYLSPKVRIWINIFVWLLKFHTIKFKIGDDLKFIFLYQYQGRQCLTRVHFYRWRSRSCREFWSHDRLDWICIQCSKYYGPS